MIPVQAITLISNEHAELLRWASRQPSQRQSVLDLLESMRKMHVSHLEHIGRVAELKETHERLVEAGSAIAANISTLERILSELAA